MENPVINLGPTISSSHSGGSGMLGKQFTASPVSRLPVPGKGWGPAEEHWVCSGHRVLWTRHRLTVSMWLGSERQGNQLPPVETCFNNWPTFPMDLAKMKDSMYYSQYMEDIKKDPSYDLNKRQLKFPSIVNTSLQWSHQKVTGTHGSKKPVFPSVSFNFISLRCYARC